MIGSSRWTLRLSILMPRRLRIASAMSWVVTEPNRRPSSPACWLIVSTVLLSSSAYSCGALDRRRARPAPRPPAALGRLDGALGRRLRRACAGSGSCAGSPWRRRRRCPSRRASRRPGAGWPRASSSGPRGRGRAAAPAAPARSSRASATYGSSASSRARLTRGRDLALVAAARAGDAPRADLAALGDEAAQRRGVLVVDLLDLVLAVRAGLAPPASRGRPSCRAGGRACDCAAWPLWSPSEARNVERAPAAREGTL